jgi:hypothetical protein
MSYRDVFDQAMGDAPPSGVDVDRVVRRQRRAAKVRPVLATLVAVLVVGAGAGTAIRLTAGDEDEGPPVPFPAGDLAGFPSYVDGAMVVAAAEASIDDGTLSLTFTRTDGEERLITRCYVPPDPDESPETPSPSFGETYAPPADPAPEGDLGGRLFADVSLLNDSLEVSYCPVLDLLGGAGTWGEFWDAYGVRLGDSVTITVELTVVWPVFDNPVPLPLPSEGTFGLAVAVPVPFEDYPFPSPPATLAPLPDGNPTDFELRAEPADPNQRVQGTVVWGPDWCEAGVLPLELASQTPGYMEVRIDDGDSGAVFFHTWWDYEGNGVALGLDSACDELARFTPGDEVTITVVPEHMTGDWVARINTAGG